MSAPIAVAMVDYAEFETLVTAVVRRFYAQNARPPPPAAELTRFAVQLRQLVAERGLPRPLRPDEIGAPGGMSDEESAPLVARVVAGIAEASLRECARQLVKACCYPEFKQCRDSFRERSPDGSCRRQELARVRGRISGAHCVDCPHWVALAPEQHARYLRREWHGDATVFDAHREVFLPEDYRALRRWLHAAARTA